LHRGPGLASGEAAGKAVSADALLTKAATISAANEVSFFIICCSFYRLDFRPQHHDGAKASEMACDVTSPKWLMQIVIPEDAPMDKPKKILVCHSVFVVRTL
jgi:hypothetical protein